MSGSTTTAIDYGDGTVDLARDGAIIDTLSGLATESAEFVLNRHGWQTTGEWGAWMEVGGGNTGRETEVAARYGWDRDMAGRFVLVAGHLPDSCRDSYAFVWAPTDAEAGPRCRACGDPMLVTVRGHHHSENGKDVT